MFRCSEPIHFATDLSWVLPSMQDESAPEIDSGQSCVHTRPHLKSQVSKNAFTCVLGVPCCYAKLNDRLIIAEHAAAATGLKAGISPVYSPLSLPPGKDHSGRQACQLAHVLRQEATKTFLGASAVMSNGTVISRVGTAAVAMVSEGVGRPVLICCETYKFAERVQLDSITANELGNPQALLEGPPARVAPSPLAAWRELPHLGESSTAETAGVAVGAQHMSRRVHHMHAYCCAMTEACSAGIMCVLCCRC